MKKGRIRGNRAQTLRLLVYLFVALMVIPLIMIFKNIFDFEGRASAMTDAVKTAEMFKKDYLLALYAPVDNITICFEPPNIEPCPITMRTPLVFNVPNTALNKYAPAVYVNVEDPPWNATLFLDIGVYGHYGGGLTSIDTVQPRLRTQNCWQTTIDGVDYKNCRFNCTNPIKISKIRHEATNIGEANWAIIDNISVEQGVGGC